MNMHLVRWAGNGKSIMETDNAFFCKFHGIFNNEKKMYVYIFPFHLD